MSDKYIIKNCPAYYINTCGDSKVKEQYCSDCTDCVLKQIVEKCEQYKKDFSTTNGVWLLANNITNLLEIKEVE